MMPLQIQPVDPVAVELARSTRRDVNDTPVETVLATGGEALRCCLTDAARGDDLLLFGYRPHLPAASPYLETGAIFVHATTCVGPSSKSSYPSAWLHRPQVLRAYDRRGWIHPATTAHNGADAPTALRHVLAQEGVVEVHSRNTLHGCFMFAARLPD